MRYHWWLLIGVWGWLFVTGPGCANPQRIADHTRQRAEYVERFAASRVAVDRAVREGLTVEGYDIVNTWSLEKESGRVVRARKGQAGSENAIWATVLIEAGPGEEPLTRMHLQTQRMSGPVDSSEIVESIKRAAGSDAVVTAAETRTDDASSSHADEADDSGDDERRKETEPDFVEAVPQSSAYALVIGIEQYRDLPSPTGAAADAERMTALLTTSLGLPDDHVRTLVDDRATRTDLEGALEWVSQSVPDGGRIYFYYAGHGTPHPKKGTSLVLPYEASQSNLTGSGLSLDRILSILEKSGAKSIIAFVDACFSGEGSRSVTAEGQRPTVPVELVAETQKRRSVVYAASKSDQISGPNADKTGGLFTAHLVRALGTGEADIDGNGQITIAELDTFVTPRVAREAEKLSRQQQPDLKLGPGVDDPESLSVTWGLPVD